MTLTVSFQHKNSKDFIKTYISKTFVGSCSKIGVVKHGRMSLIGSKVGITLNLLDKHVKVSL